MDEVSFGEWLKRQRSGRGLTQQQLAQQIGCAAITLRKIEAEERRPSAQIAERIAEIFNIPQNEKIAFLRFARGGSSALIIKHEAAPWSASPTTSRSNLPASLTSFIGREQDIALVREYLANPDIRIITLIGPPGIGKTRLSIAAAHEALSDFADGAFFIALAPLEDSSLVTPTIVQTLGFSETELKSPLDRLKDGIGDKHMLLVLDNLEHIIEGAALLVSNLLSACPRLEILTTSREALRVPGEWLYSVPVLNIPQNVQLQSMDLDGISRYAALRLFAERARAVRSDFVLNAENIEAVCAICIQLDGLPLAIELIAARVRLMSPQGLLAKLNDQFVLSADGMRAVPARQKTLHNAINWSYNLLSQEEQNLFVGLSVFSGGFTIDAAEAIFSRTVTSKPISDLVASLLDKSLLHRTPGLQGESRFSMLVTIQQFSLDRLRHLGAEVEVRNLHRDYFLDLAEQADKQIHGPHQVEWLDRLEIEHDNYRAVLDWCITSGRIESALYLIGSFSGLGRFWSVRNYLSEACNWFNKVRASPEVTLYPISYAMALNGMSFIAALQSDHRSAIAMAEESQRISKSLGPDGELALAGALWASGLAAFWFGGDVAQAEVCYERAAAIYQARGTPWEQAFALLRLGVVAGHRKNYRKSLLLFEDSLGIFRELDDAFGLARVYGEISFLYVRQGDYDQARKVDEQALFYDKKLRFQHAVSRSLVSLATFSRIQGDYDQAAAYLEQAASTRYEFNLLDENSRFYLGCVKLHGRNFAEARLCFIEHLKINRKHNLQVNIGESLIGLGAVAAGLLQYERSARLAGAGRALQDVFSYEMALIDLLEIDPLLQIARKYLGEERFESLAAEGHAMTMEKALAYALEEID